jgi:hypothetical protein
MRTKERWLVKSVCCAPFGSYSLCLASLRSSRMQNGLGAALEQERKREKEALVRTVPQESIRFRGII